MKFHPGSKEKSLATSLWEALKKLIRGQKASSRDLMISDTELLRILRKERNKEK